MINTSDIKSIINDYEKYRNKNNSHNNAIKKLCEKYNTTPEELRLRIFGD